MQGKSGDVTGQRGTRLSWTKHRPGGKSLRKEGDDNVAEVKVGRGRVGVILLRQQGVMVHNEGFTTNKGNANCVDTDYYADNYRWGLRALGFKGIARTS